MENVARIAVIGCGRVAGHHCRSIRNNKGAELVAVCDLLAERAVAYGREFEVPSYQDYRAMLRRHPEVNVVALVTPSGMHYEHAFEMIESYGKHVVVEKPTFMRLSQLNGAYDAATRAGVKVFPVFQNRHNLAVQRVKKAICSGELGAVRVAAVRVRWCRPQRYYDLAPWRGTFSHDGGALTNQGIHHLDLLRYFCGEVARVNMSMRTFGAEIEVEDTVVGSFELKSGAVGNLEVTTAARPIDYEASLSLVCEHGLVQLGGIAVNELQVFTPDPQSCRASSEDFSGNVYGHGHERMYAEIVSCLTPNSAMEYSVSRQDCLSTLAVLHTCYRSAEGGGWAEVSAAEESVRLGRADEAMSRLYRSALD